MTDLSLDLSTCGDFCGEASSAEGAILSGDSLFLLYIWLATALHAAIVMSCLYQAMFGSPAA